MKAFFSHTRKKSFTLFVLMGISTISYAVPFSITPKSGTSFLPTITMPTRGSSVTVYYTVTNNTGSQRNNNYVKYLPPNVRQVTNGGSFSDTCNAQFNLAPKGKSGDSCTLQLTATGLVNGNDPDPHHHLFVCFPGGITCAGPNPNDTLNIVEGQNELTRVAVGMYNPGSVISDPQTPIAYFTHDGGINGIISTGQPPRIETNSSLFGIACAGNNGLFCTAVGTGGSTLHPVTYFSQDSGESWSYSLTQPPWRGSGTSILEDVSCVGLNGLLCSAVGSFTSVLNHSNPSNSILAPVSYISRDGGNTWSASKTQPAYQGSGSSLLYGVSCHANNGLLCSAVGYKTVGGVTQPIAYISQDGGDNWALAATQPPFQGEGESALRAVSCTGNNGLLCTAVGYFRNTTYPLSYVSRDGGNTWTLSSTLPPKQNPTTSKSELLDVDCKGDDGLLCSAVGYFASGSNNQPATYITRDGGNTWFVSARQPASSVSSQLQGVICKDSSGLICTAVGTQGSGASTKAIAFVSQDGGNIWAAPIPTGWRNLTPGFSSLRAVG